MDLAKELKKQKKAALVEMALERGMNEPDVFADGTTKAVLIGWIIDNPLSEETAEQASEEKVESIQAEEFSTDTKPVEQPESIADLEDKEFSNGVLLRTIKGGWVITSIKIPTMRIFAEKTETGFLLKDEKMQRNEFDNDQSVYAYLSKL